MGLMRWEKAFYAFQCNFFTEILLDIHRISYKILQHLFSIVFIESDLSPKEILWNKATDGGVEKKVAEMQEVRRLNPCTEVSFL